MCEHSLLFFKIEHSLNTTHQHGTEHNSIKTANYRAVSTLEVRGLLQMAGDRVSVKIDASSFKPTVIHLPEATTSPRLRVDLIKQSFHFVLMREL